MAEYPKQELLVSPEQLAEQLDSPKVRVIDARGVARYAGGHIRNAGNLPVARLDDPATGALLPPERFGTLLGNLSIGNDDLVVFYDDGPSLMAARAFWVFEYYGHERLAILNGGLAAWVTAKRELVQEPASFESKKYVATPHPERGVTKNDVKERVGKAGTVFLDNRSRDEYTGAVMQALRAGHIPGAKFLEWSSALRPEAVPLFKSPEELGKMLGEAGATPDKEVITYCQSGARSAHTYFALRLMGFERVSNYPGSWGDWGNDPSLPVEQGD